MIRVCVPHLVLVRTPKGVSNAFVHVVTDWMELEHSVLIPMSAMKEHDVEKIANVGTVWDLISKEVFNCF